MSRSGGPAAGVHVLAALIALRIWDLVLLKRFLDQPLRVALWFGAFLGAVLVARRLARRRDPAARTRLQRRLARLDGSALGLLVFFLVMLLALHWGYRRAASDGREYYVQVRSLVMDGDVDFSNENATFGVRGTADIYAVGAPLLWTPFFTAAHGWLGVLNLAGGQEVRDGYNNPYQRAVGVGTWFYGCVGLVLLFRIAAGYVARPLAAAAVIAGVSGSFLLWYFVVELSMPHAVSLAAAALFVWLWQQHRDTRTTPDWARLGLAAGLMTIVRWQNIGFTILLVPELVRRTRSGIRDRDTWRSLAAQSGAFSAAFALAVLPQLLFWKLTRGGWLAIPAASHSVSLASARDVLFTPDHGLFTWTPLMILAVAGGLVLAARDPALGLPLLLAFAFQVWVLGMVGEPGYGFGARRLASAGVLFLPGLALALDLMRRRPLLAPALLVAPLIVVNLAFMASVHSRQLPATGDVPGERIATMVLRRIGNPFSLPANVWFAWRYDTDLEHYERLGTQRFNNVRIDVGGEGDRRFLAHGWSAAETPDAGPTFRWSDGGESALLVRLREQDDYTLHLRAGSLAHPAERPQRVEVEINGRVVGGLAVRPGFRDYSFEIPATAVRAGPNRLVFRYAWAASPAELGSSDDPRRLAMQFDRIELLRR